MNTVNVAILGGSGYTAVELMKILLRHPHAKIAAVTSRERTPVAELHPSLFQRLDLIAEPRDAAALVAKRVQCAFVCLPHTASMAAVPALLAAGIRVIDLSADYRLKKAETYARWYKEPHTDPANLAHAVYGLPEHHADAIRTATLVANPGCYPQTAILGIAPLIANDLIDLDSIIIDSKSGVSGAGREPKKASHFPECNESVSAYAIGTHRHTPEIDQELTRIAPRFVQVTFTPHLMPMDRGIFSTIYANASRPISEIELVARFQEHYQGKPFVRVRTSLPATKDTLLTNFLDICPKIVNGRIIVLACEDNLVRGASGVAVQNFNLMFGFPETAGLG